MKNIWFKRVGWIHLSVSVPGALIALVALAFCAQVFLAIDRHSHSASDTLDSVFPFFACTFLLFDWVAHRTSVNSDRDEK